MRTILKQPHIICITLFLFPFVGYTQVPAKESGKEGMVIVAGDSTPVHPEASKSFAMDSCISRLEENEVKVLMDTITSIIHVDFYCLCSDYLTDVKVKLSNEEHTYERITDKLGCDFRHIQPGNYWLEVDYEAARKFEPVEVMVEGGARSRWKIFLCEE